MTDYFALFGEARRPWLEPAELKEKYFARSRTAAPSAELNEAFRVLSDPKLRLHHLLTLAGAELTAGEPQRQRDHAGIGSSPATLPSRRRTAVRSTMPSPTRSRISPSRSLI